MVIALVEDNEDNRLLVCAMLEHLYEIHEYEHGEAALEGMAAKVPDCILLDINLPGMDGIRVLKEIRASDTLRGIPVIALTAHAMRGEAAHFLGLGFDAYITKPILDEAELLNAIESVRPAR